MVIFFSLVSPWMYKFKGCRTDSVKSLVSNVLSSHFSYQIELSFHFQFTFDFDSRSRSFLFTSSRTHQKPNKKRHWKWNWCQRSGERRSRENLYWYWLFELWFMLFFVFGSMIWKFQTTFETIQLQYSNIHDKGDFSFKFQTAFEKFVWRFYYNSTFALVFQVLCLSIISIISVWFYSFFCHNNWYCGQKENKLNKHKLLWKNKQIF